MPCLLVFPLAVTDLLALFYLLNEFISIHNFVANSHCFVSSFILFVLMDLYVEKIFNSHFSEVLVGGGCIQSVLIHGNLY